MVNVRVRVTQKLRLSSVSITTTFRHCNYKEIMTLNGDLLTQNIKHSAIGNTTLCSGYGAFTRPIFVCRFMSAVDDDRIGRAFKRLTSDLEIF